MKNLLYLFLLIVAIYYGYRYWTAEEAPSTTAASPTPAKHFARPGVYYLLDYYSITTDHGVVGWTPGQEVKAVPGAQNAPGQVKVSDGELQASLNAAQLTQDMDLAAKLRSTDTTDQTKAARIVAALKAKAEADKRRADIQAAAELEAAKARQRAGLPPVAATPALH